MFNSIAVMTASPHDPFALQLPALPPAGKGGLLVFSRGAPIAENAASAPALMVQHLEAPARRSRRGYAEWVEGANSATILGPRHADVVLRGIDHVARYA